MPAIDERQHVRRHIGIEVASRLRWAQVAAHREDRQQVSLGRLPNLRIAPGQRPKVPREMRPVLDVREDIEHVACRQARIDPLLQGDRAGWDLFRNGLAQDRLAFLVDRDVFALVRKFILELARRVGQPLTQLSNELATGFRQADLRAVIGQLLLTLPPRQQVIAASA